MRRDERDQVVTRSLGVLQEYVVGVPRVAVAPEPLTPAAPKEQSIIPPSAGLSDIAARALRCVAERGPQLIERLADEFTIERGECWRVRGELEQRAYTTAGTIANKRAWIALTPAGADVARSARWRVLAYKSGEKHQVCVNSCEWRVADQHVRCFAKGAARSLDSNRLVEPDLLAARADGLRAVFQVSDTNTVPAELSAVAALAADASLHRILLISVAREKREAIEKAIKKSPVDSRVVVLDLERLLRLTKREIAHVVWGNQS